ncbi:Dye-decolorizing peroxidase msp1 [Lachnellula suecica]|uniref:Dye-decolorizing peroxidase msp1 n=1 Tax=Lachnellula suecica TaxID=602035 RepID=A0A8T9BXN3_9HELO|nr:Dye-decolorizing peroxidase msp1 [Lachnellula suecica]
MSPPTLDLNNVQGDILLGLPKKGQTFFFFNINDGTIPDFCIQLGHLVPLITTVAQVQDDQARISKEKEKAKAHHTNPQILDMTGVNISFSQKGLLQLSINDEIGDPAFTAGQFADVANFADDPTKWDPEFKAGVHGVIYITGSSHSLIDSQLAKVKTIFGVGGPGATITEVKVLQGHVRPGDETGHEHFGFLDGVSQPAIQGISTPANRGQETVDQGVILLGREGDNGIVPPGGRHDADFKFLIEPEGVTRPTWALDGSFFVFRHLQQLVPEFNDFLEKNALDVPIPILLGNPSGADLLGARLVGRWKSGAPIDLTPLKDDPAMGANPAQNDAFRFDVSSQARCPFAAHIRKTNPRADLDAFGGTEVRRILRRGIQFGPEVTRAEAAAKRSSTDIKLERGLLFACYQSNIVNGFQFVQQSWANNVSFPPKLGVPTPGIDPIIGQAATRALVGVDPDVATKELDLTAEWVVSKGGEYFFSPSISALRDTFVQAA